MAQPIRIVTIDHNSCMDETLDALKVVAQTSTGVDIGDVGHNITTIVDGVKVVGTAGVDVALSSGSTPAKLIVVQAQTDNTSKIAVGATGVDATVATGTGIILDPGDTMTLPISDLINVYIDALVSGEGVRYTYFS